MPILYDKAQHTDCQGKPSFLSYKTTLEQQLSGKKNETAFICFLVVVLFWCPVFRRMRFLGFVILNKLSF